MKNRIERSSDRDRGITAEYIKEQIELRKRQLATPGFLENEEREQRAAAARSKGRGIKFPELLKRGTKPALVTGSTTAARHRLLDKISKL